jgi:uncharacterized protein with HEPN domain
VSRDVSVYVADMLDSARRVERYSRGLDLEAFRQHDMVYDAILRNLEVLGEAAKGVPEQTRAAWPEIQWRAIAGLRDVLIHRYFGLEDETVWDAVVNSIPALVAQLEELLVAECPPAAGMDAQDSSSDRSL